MIFQEPKQLRHQEGAWRNDDGDPVDMVEVVRCGECVHRTDPRRISCKGRRKDWFCADGERRVE